MTCCPLTLTCYSYLGFVSKRGLDTLRLMLSYPTRGGRQSHCTRSPAHPLLTALLLSAACPLMLPLAAACFPLLLGFVPHPSRLLFPSLSLCHCFFQNIFFVILNDPHNGTPASCSTISRGFKHSKLMVLRLRFYP